MSTVVAVRRDRIEIQAPFAIKDIVKTIPQARWDKEAKVWWTKASPTNLVAVNETLTEAAPNESIFWDDSCQPLIDAAWRLEDAKAIKVSDELPDHPSKTPSWLHQRRAYEFLGELGYGGLFADMGCGKSKVIVDLVANHGWRRGLILCPRKVIGVWPKQFRLHSAADIQVMPLVHLDKIGADGQPVGMTIRERIETIDSHYDTPVVFVTSFEATQHEEFREALLESGNLDWLALDEAHRIKKPGGVMSMFLSRMAEKVPHRFALTGTPLHHRPLDIYAVYRFLDKGIFGTSFARFRDRYAQMDYRGYKVESYINEDELSERMWRIAFRVTKDILDLPEEISIERTFSLEPTTSKLYQAMKKEGIVRIGNSVSSTSNVLTKRLRLHQLTGGSVRMDDGEDIQVGPGKEDLLEDVLTDLPEGDPVVVACLYYHDLDVVHSVAHKLGLRSGEVSGRHSDLTADSTYPEGIDVLAVQIRAGGVGIDLSRSHYCIFYSMGESLGDYRQFQSRLHRPGQTDPVRYIHLLAENTIDELIYGAIQANAEIADHIQDHLREQEENLAPQR